MKRIIFTVSMLLVSINSFCETSFASFRPAAQAIIARMLLHRMVDAVLEGNQAYQPIIQKASGDITHQELEKFAAWYVFINKPAWIDDTIEKYKSLLIKQLNTQAIDGLSVIFGEMEKIGYFDLFSCNFDETTADAQMTKKFESDNMSSWFMKHFGTEQSEIFHKLMAELDKEASNKICETLESLQAIDADENSIFMNLYQDNNIQNLIVRADY